MGHSGDIRQSRLYLDGIMGSQVCFRGSQESLMEVEGCFIETQGVPEVLGNIRSQGCLRRSQWLSGMLEEISRLFLEASGKFQGFSGAFGEVAGVYISSILEA